MAGAEATTHLGGRRGKLDQLLGDPGTWIRTDRAGRGVELLVARLVAEYQPFATRSVHRLEHKVLETSQRVLQLIGLAQAVSRNVGQDRLFSKVVGGHRRHVGADQLVVRHPVAHRVGYRDRPCPGRIQQAGTADHRIRAELNRVQELVVDPAVDNVDPLLPGRAPHEHGVPPADEVAPVDQLDSHLPSQEAVLEVRRVVGPWREHHDCGLSHTLGGAGTQAFQQHGGIAVDRSHPVAGEQLRKHPRHGPAVLDGPRARSIPAIWIRTPFGERIPAAAR